MNGNPFYVHPGGDLTRGLAGLTQQVGQIGEQKRLDQEKQLAAQKEQEAKQREQEIKGRVLEAYKSNDPDKLAEVMINHPEIAKATRVAELDAMRDETALKNSFDASYRFLADPTPENLEKSLSMAVDSNGEPIPDGGIRELYQSDPEAAINKIKMRSAAADPERYMKFKEAVEGKGESEKPAETVAFETLIKDFSLEDQEKAKKIKAGLTARAVGSSDMTIQQLGIADLIGDVKATINERAKFGDMQGSQRSQAIDKGFEKVTKLQQNIVNLENAVDAVRAGAGTGAIEKRFPSIKESSVLLDQVQGALALDVIGSVTFGALSEGELNLAKAIAIPTGLEGPALEKWLLDKKQSQEKLLNYFKEQIDFLDQGGSVAGFLRKKSREAKDSSSKTIKFDAQGNIIQ